METLIGKKFGKLTVLRELIRNYKSSNIIGYEVICDCGNVAWFTRNLIVSGKRTECNKGAHNKHFIRKDLVGKTINYLTVIEYDYNVGKWKCKCVCGKIRFVSTWELSAGKAKSCGCKYIEQLRSRNIKPDGYSFKHALFRNYRKAAKRLGHEFTISKELFFELMMKNCHYCGSVPTMKPATKRIDDLAINFRYNGIDRINNTLGYIEGNVVSCCKICNNSKSTLTLNMWLDWINRLYKKQNLQ